MTTKEEYHNLATSLIAQDRAAGLVLGRVVNVDQSGVGHCWRVANDIPANVREEIEGEMIDGKLDYCSDFLASNGLRYRW